MSYNYKRYQCRKAPSFHKGDSVSYDFSWKWWDAPLKTRRSWKDTSKSRTQYKPVEM